MRRLRNVLVPRACKDPFGDSFGGVISRFLDERIGVCGAGFITWMHRFALSIRK